MARKAGQRQRSGSEGACSTGQPRYHRAFVESQAGLTARAGAGNAAGTGNAAGQARPGLAARAGAGSPKASRKKVRAEQGGGSGKDRAIV